VRDRRSVSIRSGQVGRQPQLRVSTQHCDSLKCHAASATCAVCCDLLLCWCSRHSLHASCALTNSYNIRRRRRRLFFFVLLCCVCMTCFALYRKSSVLHKIQLSQHTRDCHKLHGWCCCVRSRCGKHLLVWKWWHKWGLSKRKPHPRPPNPVWRSTNAAAWRLPRCSCCS
jgi:hypothetical protein